MTAVAPRDTSTRVSTGSSRTGRATSPCGSSPRRPATTIADALVYRGFSVGPSAAYRSPIAELEAVSSSGATTVLAACAQTYGCLSAGTGPLSEFDPSNVLDYTGLAGVTAIDGTAGCGGGLTCAAGGGASCPELGSDPCLAGNHLYAMVVTLEDDTAPTVSGVGGTLLAPGPIAGVADVDFSATDTGSGLYSATVTVDGVALARSLLDANDPRCVPIDGPGSSGAAIAVMRFSWTVPCALAGSGTVALDTRALADGAHSVVVSVFDAAGNAATAWSGTIHTDNAPQGGIPQIFGDAQQGQTLIAGTGTWMPAPTGFAYQWQRCDAAGNNCVADRRRHRAGLRGHGRRRVSPVGGRRDGLRRRRLDERDLAAFRRRARRQRLRRPAARPVAGQRQPAADRRRGARGRDADARSRAAGPTAR